MTPSDTPDHEQRLHALADGRLPPEQARAFLDALDAADRERVQHWKVQRQRLRALHSDLLTETPPPELSASAMRLQARINRQHRILRWGGIAAGWLLAFGLGWVGQAQLHAPAAPALAQNAPMQRFARAATVAHALYQPEQRHPVEVAASDQAHLLQWLSKRLGRKLQIPDLSAAGYELVGGRLLPGDDSQARAQFMYQNEQGLRITLYLGAMPRARAETGTGETRFHFAHNGHTHAYYWVDQGFGYALAADLPRASLLHLAALVHQQLY